MAILNHTNVFIYFLILSFIFGCIFGSFLNCMADRIQKGLCWWKGHSVCDTCGHQLGILDLFPIFSFVLLKGKCRYCGSKLSKKYIYTEVLLGLIFVGYVLEHKKIDVKLIESLGMICILYGLSLCDINTYEIPNGFIIFGCIWTFIFQLLEGNQLLDIGIHICIAFVFSGAVLLLSLLLNKILHKETMGLGDIKLLFMCGLHLSIVNNFLELLIACVLGLIIGIILKKDKIPFGPSISLAWLITMLFGEVLIKWYISVITL